MGYVFYLTSQGHYGVVEKTFWEENHHLSDKYDSDLVRRMERLGFDEAMENQFEYNGDGDPIGILTEAGFIQVAKN